MNWQQEYQRKRISVDEAVGQITSGSSIGAAMAGAAPPGLLNALGTRKDVEDVRVFSALLLQDFSFYLDPTMKGRFLLESWFYGAGERRGEKIGNVSLIPSHGRDWGRRKALFDPPDVFWGTATPMDQHGFFSLSLSVGYEKELMPVAKNVVLEINHNLPRTYGDTHVHISQVDWIVEHDAPLIELPVVEPSLEESIIGAYVADLIEDGATIQLGIGGIPNAITTYLKNKHDLGVHTEMFTDGMVDLAEAGVITGRYKTLWPGKMVGNFALGTKKLYDFIKENLAVEFQSGRVTNDPCIIAKNDKMVSVNTALQIDLTGQVVSESIGHTQFSGTGGQTDTAIGAQMSSGGKSIIALKSTAKKGTVSSIVPALPEGAKVTLLRADVDYVVTEFGIAHLKARSLRERVRQLVGIAHPDFRMELEKEAQRLRLW